MNVTVTLSSRKIDVLLQMPPYNTYSMRQDEKDMLVQLHKMYDLNDTYTNQNTYYDFF